MSTPNSNLNIPAETSVSALIPSDPAPSDPNALHPQTPKVVKFPGRPKIKRRVRSLVPPETPGYETTAAIHAAEPPSSFLQHLHDANLHFLPACPLAGYLTLLYTRSLWSMGRADVAFAAAINLAIDSQWDKVSEEWEEIDPASRAVLAADMVAAMPGHRALNIQFSLHLRRFALLHRVLTTTRKAA